MEYNLTGLPFFRVSPRAPFLVHCCSLYINDKSSDIESEIRLFPDDSVCYREIKDEEDTIKLQKDIDRLGSWARKWGISAGRFVEILAAVCIFG